MLRQGFLRFGSKRPFLLFALIVLCVLIAACGAPSNTTPNIPTVEASPVVTEIATEIPALEMTPVELPSPTEKLQVIEGELALYYLREIYKDNITGWWVQSDSGEHEQYMFVDVDGNKVNVDTNRITFDFANEMAVIYDNLGNPEYVRQDGTWTSVMANDTETWYIREKNLNSRFVDWDPESKRWKLSMPLTNEQLQLLGPYYSIAAEDNLVYDGPEGKFTVVELDEGRDLKILTAEGGEMEFPPENLKIIRVKGADFKGRPIDAILTMEADGWGPMNEFIYTPSWGAEWTSTLDVAASREAQSFEEIPEITWEDFMSGRYFYSELRALRDFPNALDNPQLMVEKLSGITNLWAISQWWRYDPDRGIDNSQNELTAQNDPIRPLGLARLRSPMSPEEWMIVVSMQYPADGRAAILHAYFVDEMARPDADLWTILQLMKEPARFALEPLVSTRPEDWCGAGGLGAAYSQQTICDLQGTDGLPLPREVLPRDLQQMMAEFDTETQPSGLPTQLYPVTPEMLFRLQGLPLAQYTRGGDLPTNYYNNFDIKIVD